MRTETIKRFQIALFVISLDHLDEPARALVELAWLYHIRHVWALDSLYRLAAQGNRVVIQSSAN